jgi:S-DNA-T family DNA segregation ATPase FtsK/SpoIIIE
VKVSKILSLSDDLALNLAAPDVRIEAPIPGKAAIGIEVPNKIISVVYLKEVLEDPYFQSSSSPLTIGLGKDIAGVSIFADLLKMPHLLIAGSTGSGKSVCINTIICSILFKANPGAVKFLLIDPKLVELNIYNGVPHLLSPVITEPKKAAVALRGMVKEMIRRYDLFARQGVRDIGRYNELCQNNESDAPGERLPYIVVIIDELADLMMVAPSEVEDSIVRLSQMSRAAGIHLIIATQRPSVDIITGLIKANITSRIAFAVSSQIDSRTILDVGGAEKLLGRGDMLYYPIGLHKPLRVQGAFISEKDISTIIEFIKQQGSPLYQESLFFNVEENEAISVEEEKEKSDPLLPEVVELIIQTGHASISLVQRRFRVGYTRAGRLIDELERFGVVGKHEGSKPRKVLMNREQAMISIKEGNKKT